MTENFPGIYLKRPMSLNKMRFHDLTWNREKGKGKRKGKKGNQKIKFGEWDKQVCCWVEFGLCTSNILQTQFTIFSSNFVQNHAVQSKAKIPTYNVIGDYIAENQVSWKKSNLCLLFFDPFYKIVEDQRPSQTRIIIIKVWEAYLPKQGDSVIKPHKQTT